ncbi:MAG: hypothetical protein IJY20_03755 [Clostridia bacterium]|nr:hypothetical protein [Clostridia bacterium]
MKKMVFWFLCGAVIYPSVEVLWRGHSHWSMALAGGVCAVLLLYLNGLWGDLARPLRALLGAGLICMVEFLFGVVFNLFLRMAVWDYSALPYNLLGQISLRYFLLWCGLSYLLTWVFDRVWDGEDIREKIFRAVV